MTYRNFYLQAMSAADQIQSGEYQKVRAEKTQDMVARQDSTLVRRPEKKTEEKEYTFNDTLLEYMRIANLAGEDFGEGTGSNLETGEDPAWVKDTSTEGVSLSSKDVNLGQVAIGIREAAEELGIDPVDLATTISYETGGTFNPTQKGPTTKWGQHKGLIQFGEPQAKEHGVRWDDPYNSQLGRDGAVVSYLRSRGVTPGMGLLDLYSTINTGAPGLHDRSDAGAGGAPGTVADKVAGMAAHRKKALLLMDNLSAPRRNPIIARRGQ